MKTIALFRRILYYNSYQKRKITHIYDLETCELLMGDDLSVVPEEKFAFGC